MPILLELPGLPRSLGTPSLYIQTFRLIPYVRGTTPLTPVSVVYSKKNIFIIYFFPLKTPQTPLSSAAYY
jgi:hypothetical protein